MRLEHGRGLANGKKRSKGETSKEATNPFFAVSLSKRSRDSESFGESSRKGSKHDIPQPQLTETALVEIKGLRRLTFTDLPKDTQETFWMPEPRGTFPGPNCPPAQEITETSSSNEPVIAFLGMPDPKLHRYPLPAHHTPLDHTLHECGAPGFCEHLEPHDSAITFINESPIYFAPEPKIFFDKSAKRYKDNIIIDKGLISQELQSVGFDESTANAFAIVVHTKQDLVEQLWDAGGWYNPESPGMIESVEDHDLCYPITIHVILGGDEANLNNTIWHEFGHAERDKLKNKKTKYRYNDSKAQTITKRVGMGGVAVGMPLLGGTLLMLTGDTGSVPLDIGGMILGTMLASAGTVAETLPKHTLWQLDREEMHARWLAHKRKGLSPLRFEE